MKPVDFQLHRPQTLAETLTLLHDLADDVKVLAGGQSLLPLLNFRLARPAHVVDIGRVVGLARLRRTSSELSIGATVRHAEAERSPSVAAHAPLLTAALPQIAHPPVRTRGTVGGSLAHADPAAELPSVAMALDAVFVAASTSGERTIPAAEFFRTHLTTALRPDELLTEIRFPRAAPGTGAAFLEVGRRRGDFALVGAAVQVTVDGPRIAEARVCLSGVGQIPHRCPAAEEILTGAPLGSARVREAADAVRDSVRPSDDLHATAAYRKDVAGTLLVRAVTKAARRAESADRKDET
ncbi:FAD binding domain-containing protein [Streptomyces melanosporofaciens]|uniref:Carbon-monoxide dehydrogenase medium subunit n=1 Tax=Streptomyces melanosporofaciens TaxID=67327 RepID=A0A1H4KKF9_STRMJ|nr:xanthine dehydrogenase family protein subunit M [Streptomyces melanosporofaciens]SEB59044.1 carbon-monoxide dehydrogenase medium subunit [Streptomyces melanosporofaciens]